MRTPGSTPQRRATRSEWSPAQPLEPVRQAAALQFLEPWQLVLVHRHHDLAAAFAGDAPFGAEAVERLAPLDAVPGLERTGLVAGARVDDAAVVPRLVRGQPVLGLEHDGRGARALGERQGGGQADDAAADHGDFAAVRDHARRGSMPRRFR
jgi:hypothetical protein